MHRIDISKLTEHYDKYHCIGGFDQYDIWVLQGGVALYHWQVLMIDVEKKANIGFDTQPLTENEWIHAISPEARRQDYWDDAQAHHVGRAMAIMGKPQMLHTLRFLSLFAPQVLVDPIPSIAKLLTETQADTLTG